MHNFHNAVEQYGSVVARILLSALFLVSGTQFVLNFSSQAEFVGTLVPFAVVVSIIVVAVKLLGGLSVLLGFKTEWGAWALFAFALLTILFVHNNAGEMIAALKNLAIMGGLLMLVIYGPGPMSLDRKKEEAEEMPVVQEL